MQKDIFTSRISKESRLFLEQSYEQKKKQISSQPFDARWEFKRASGSFSAFVIAQAVRQCRSEFPEPKDLVLQNVRPPQAGTGRKTRARGRR